MQGTYERHLGQTHPRDVWREIMLNGSQDIGRAIDYLETRDDIDMQRLAYMGQSLGAGAGAIMTAMEPRFKASVFVAGGLHGFRPEPLADALNFVPRVKIPTLMVTGKHDFYFPYETSQKPLFDLLGTPEAYKRHKAFDSGHMPREIAELQKEVLDWLDLHLGAVRR